MPFRLALLAVFAGLASAPAALAHGDLASEYLLSHETFVPSDDGVSRAYNTQLETTVRESNARGYPIRVAVIGRRADLAAVGRYWGKPDAYARFVRDELWSVYRGLVLVVMPNGLGVSRRGEAQPREQAAVARLGAPGADGHALAAAATRAVTEVASSEGVFIPRQPLKAGGSSGNRDRITIAAAALLATGILLYRRRRTSV